MPPGSRVLQPEPRFSSINTPSSSRIWSLTRSRSIKSMSSTHPSSSKVLSALSQRQSSSKIPSCLSPSSAFYQVLTAPYRQVAPLPVARPTMVADATISSGSQRRSYISHGRWAWADGLTIDETEEILALHSAPSCSTTVNKGTLGHQQITYISKCWKSPPPDGFYSELELYRAEHYLRPLQGLILPWIIGVNVLPDAISIAMEPPHHSFWVEASPEMPTILKQRCIEAFEKLHERGILHGDVELCHMLVGGDGKVTIVDFHASRALVPNSSVMLLGAEPRELRLEMRRVKYKLDYEGAKEIEIAKRMRAEAGRKNYLEEDLVDPPVDTDDWVKGWANEAANATPTRFVVPGQTPEALVKEIHSFMVVLDHMASVLPTGKSTLDNGSRQVRFATEIASTRIFRAASSENAINNPTTSPASRKRKLGEPSRRYNTRSSKRLRSEQTMNESDEDDEPIRRGLSRDPVLVNYQNSNRRDREQFTPPRTTAEDVSEASSSQPSAASSRFPPLKVRDFAYESYDGPRGYYVPYPLLESVASLNRRRWVQEQVNKKRVKLGLPPHSAEAAPQTAPEQSLTDKHLRRLALGLSPLPHGPTEPTRPSLFDQPPRPSLFDPLRRPSLFDEPPPPPPSVFKRKRGDREREMGQDDFDEDDRRTKNARTLVVPDCNAHPVPSPVAGPSSLSPAPTGARTAIQSVEDHALKHMLGPRAHEFTPPPARPSPHPRTGARKLPVGDRLAFATLRRLAPLPAVKGKARVLVPAGDGIPAAQAAPLREGTPTDRKHDIIRRRHQQMRNASPSSEDEVETLLAPTTTFQFASSPPSFPLGSWMSYLLRWAQ